ncbi:PP2C family protein-serine/threonine phosphatase [Metamycoplasma hyosynoviae]|uniref:PP2C family protein-serine/threonine phosphatase n=1 Tax=Metamycoplasma hyosynoviae TaxID=29559 RepID=UPI00235909F3|nr:protein phosphatase 2C domain-containing protein [Metamycoplasma hyosynoviae]MDC8937619.1 protein phosphatase 2C domain-containing protein [Metamycoplasma hyosynoviae]MDD1360244.1 protein phosphatase 2C domain-containing protein [Metamycoplasma hyosynoviae]MDD7898080.1 protein phosphatase 2C domain-containing protein [Metamycoplasma hyosynoviae]
MNYCLKSDVGIVRPENQDRVGMAIKGKWALAILCDGMGGHAGGSIASTISISTFENYFNHNFPEDTDYTDKKTIKAWFVRALDRIKNELNIAAKKDPGCADMGTTLTATLIYPSEKQIYVFNVGDSRTYIYNGLLHQVTEDQNVKNQWIREGVMKPHEAERHPFANKLTSCLGPNKVMTPDGFVYSKESKAKYIVLTSDGLHDWVEKPLFERIIQANNLTLEEKANTLINYAKKNMSNDNMSIVLVEL